MPVEYVPCTLCAAEVWWALTTRGHRVALDRTPSTAGNCIPVLDDGHRRIKVLTGDEMPAQTTAWAKHVTTCPETDEGRRRLARDRQRCGDCRLPMDPWLPTNGHRWHITCGPAWPGEIRASLRKDAA